MENDTNCKSGCKTINKFITLYRYEAITNFSNTEFILFLNPTAIRKKVNKNIRNCVAINNT